MVWVVISAVAQVSFEEKEAKNPFFRQVKPNTEFSNAKKSDSLIHPAAKSTNQGKSAKPANNKKSIALSSGHVAPANISIQIKKLLKKDIQLASAEDEFSGVYQLGHAQLESLAASYSVLKGKHGKMGGFFDLRIASCYYALAEKSTGLIVGIKTLPYGYSDFHKKLHAQASSAIEFYTLAMDYFNAAYPSQYCGQNPNEKKAAGLKIDYAATQLGELNRLKSWIEDIHRRSYGGRQAQSR